MITSKFIPDSREKICAFWHAFICSVGFSVRLKELQVFVSGIFRKNKEILGFNILEHLYHSKLIFLHCSFGLFCYFHYEQLCWAYTIYVTVPHTFPNTRYFLLNWACCGFFTLHMLLEKYCYSINFAEGTNHIL